MKERTDRLSNLQITFLISSTIIGVTVLVLPRTATELVKSGGFIATFVTGILMAIVLVIEALLAKRFPGNTIVEFSKDVIGFIPAKVLGVIFFFHFISVSSTILRIFCDAIKVLLLEATPLEVLIIHSCLQSCICVSAESAQLQKYVNTLNPGNRNNVLYYTILQEF